MRTLDTNVVVRLLIGDDPIQSPIAERAFLAAIAGGGVNIPDVVLADSSITRSNHPIQRDPANSHIRPRAALPSMTSTCSVASARAAGSCDICGALTQAGLILLNVLVPAQGV